MLSTAHKSLPAFERVYREQFDFVLRTLRVLGVQDSGLDDAVQDVFVVVHRRLPEFEGRSSVKTWAYEIARRVALRYRTRAARDASRHAELPERLGAGIDLEEAIEQTRACEVLQRFLANLDEDRRRAFVLAELWEMSGREIAESLNINMNTVYARIRSARTELDRVAHRMRVRDAGAVTRSMREHRASAGTREQARVGILAAVGVGGSSGAAGAVSLVWAGLAATGCGLAVVATVLFSAPEGVESPETPTVDATVPSRAEASVSVASSVAPTDATLTPPGPAPEVSPRPSTPKPDSKPRRKSTRSELSSVSEQLAAVQEIRAAVRAEDAGQARTKISQYRRAAPQGVLLDEVDALEVELACRTRAPEAVTRLRAFAEGHRGSALVDRLTVLCSSKTGPQKTRPAGTQDP